ncbi:response regulator, partial [uncultured Halomonas sp.]|uniref:response regulator n=1 Tax=uncultured Halomonas sp. TaxID=173971 RepID=UPI0026221B1F
AGSATPAAEPTPVRRGKRRLIVDDGPVNLMLARQVLEREGYEVRTATSGAEALACLEQVPFDLVLMDIFMPGMDGVEASRRWRDVEIERYPGQRSVLVALTANASAEDRKRFVAAGLDGYLAKPYRPQQLIDLVNRWLPPSREEVPHP